MNRISKVLFLGSKQLGLRVLQEIHAMSPDTHLCVMTIDDRTDSRSVLQDLIEYCGRNTLELHIADNRAHSEQIIQAVKPDLCFVVCWYWLIRDASLNAVPFGFIGIHPSLLPAYRGGSPLIWPIIRGEEEVGFSLFSFTSGMDDGPIWAQGRVPVERQDYISDILSKLEQRTVDVLRDVFPSILNGRIVPVEQDHQMATYCAQRIPADGNIDWRQPARDVYNFIRAQSTPYPGAFTYCNSSQLRIWKASLFRHPYFGTPGQVAQIARDGVYVICGDSRAVVLEDVELDGKRGRANDLIRSINIRLSDATLAAIVPPSPPTAKST